MQETRREFIDRFLRFVGELNDTQARQVAEELVNHCLLDVWKQHPWRAYVMAQDYPLTTVAGTKDYTLPTYFGRVAKRDGRIQNVTQPSVIFPKDREELIQLHPEWGVSGFDVNGLPSHYTIAGAVGVTRQPAAAGAALEAISDNAADTDIQVTIEGNDATGAYNSLAFQLNGTNAVAVGTWKPPLVGFSKSYMPGVTPATQLYSSRGNVTLRAAGAGVSYQSLLPQEASRDQMQFSFWRTPDQVYVYAIPIIRLPRKLVHDSDPVPLWLMGALWEKMMIDWRVNTGESSLMEAAATGRPVLANEIAFDNENRAGNRNQIEPFGLV